MMTTSLPPETQLSFPAVYCNVISWPVLLTNTWEGLMVAVPLPAAGVIVEVAVGVPDKVDVGDAVKVSVILAVGLQVGVDVDVAL